jgi:phosphoglycolate phosphatase
MKSKLSIVWDWNGTLLDDVNACIDSINAMLSCREKASIGIEEYREHFGFPVRNYYRQVGFDLDVEDWDALCVEYHGHYATYSKDAALQDGALQALQTFEGLSLPMFILSACERSLLEQMVVERGIRDHFVQMYGLSNLHAQSKAHLGRELTEQHDLQGRMLLVGDTAHDFEVAMEIGCGCVLMEGGHQSRSKLEQCSCHIVSNMTELIPLVEQISSRIR